MSGFAAHTVVDDWRVSIDNDDIVGSLFIDLSKAFDSIHHQLLLSKLDGVGVHGAELAWFQSYLYDRTQCVSIGKARSSFRPISSGVPQGSILGPLLFIVFMNKLPAKIMSCETQLYADDTILYCHGKTVAEVRQKLTVAFQTANQCFQENCLRVNFKKTHTMFLGRKRRQHELVEPHIEHDGQPIRNEQTAKYLGVLIDDKLNWKQHIDSVAKKVGRNLGILRRVSKHLPMKTRKMLFNAIVLPHLDYCCVVWANCTKELQQKLQRLHNYGMRIILQVPARSPSSMSRAKLRWTTLEQRRALQQLRVVHHCIHGAAPEYLWSLFRWQPGTVRTRGQLKLFLKAHKSEIYSKSFQYSGARNWNQLPDAIKTTRNRCTFTKLVS